jgi:predicted 3-demethylubiquinone-9 3-methyltransferase (glyoxalase superfamily)
VIPKNTICVWYEGAAEEAANFYASVFPDSSVGDAVAQGGDVAKRAFEAMFPMKKIDHAAIEAAVRRR